MCHVRGRFSPIKVLLFNNALIQARSSDGLDKVVVIVCFFFFFFLRGLINLKSAETAISTFINNHTVKLIMEVISYLLYCFRLWKKLIENVFMV